MTEKTAVLRARCSGDFKQQVLEFLREYYPEEDEAWIVRNAVKEFMERKEQGGAVLNELPAGVNSRKFAAAVDAGTKYSVSSARAKRAPKIV